MECYNGFWYAAAGFVFGLAFALAGLLLQGFANSLGVARRKNPDSANSETVD